jgi:integrase
VLRFDRETIERASGRGRRRWFVEAQTQLDEQRRRDAKPIPRSRSERLLETERRMREQRNGELATNEIYEQYIAGGVTQAGVRFKAKPGRYVAPEEPVGKNITDPDSRVMQTITKGWIQGYNAQAAVNENHIVIAAEITVESPDFGHLDPIVTAVERELDLAGASQKPAVIIADAGYWHQEQMEQIAARGIPVIIPPDALTGARISELCGLTWKDVRVDDLDEAEIEFGWQVDRHGDRRPTKTDGSARTVPIPQELARVLARHKLAARNAVTGSFVFATGSGRPLQQRNVARALREAQRRAVDVEGRPTYPVLHEVDEAGEPVPVPRGVIPSMHSFRHTVASHALLAGESVDEVAFLLGHRDGTVTRTVYVREVADARRRSMRRSRMAAEFAGALRVALEDETD